MRQALFICPRCQTNLERASTERFTCPHEGLEFWNIEGIWRFLLPESEAHYARFLRDYETIRRAEGRGSNSAKYYRDLPFKDSSGGFKSDWRIRARSFKVLVNKVLTKLQDPLERSLRVLDLGAGNGWLSNRLAAQGDRVFAVDLLVNEMDGLGTWKYYKHTFTPMQAEFNHLPIMDRFADVVIFNASFHYSEDYAQTLKEALRILSPKGRVVIMDSPVYRRSSSGAKMVEEREAQFTKKYGFASDNLRSENFLTYARLDELARKFNIQWQFLTPFYGLHWMLRPLTSMLLRRREPAKFHLILGRKNT